MSVRGGGCDSEVGWLFGGGFFPVLMLMSSECVLHVNVSL